MQQGNMGETVSGENLAIRSCTGKSCERESWKKVLGSQVVGFESYRTFTVILVLGDLLFSDWDSYLHSEFLVKLYFAGKPGHISSSSPSSLSQVLSVHDPSLSL